MSEVVNILKLDNTNVFSETQIAALEHGAIISLYPSSERVLGQDTPIWSINNEKHVEINKSDSPSKFQTSEKKVIPSNVLPIKPTYTDYDGLNAFILLRDADVSRKKQIREELMNTSLYKKWSNLDFKIKIEKNAHFKGRRSCPEILNDAEKLSAIELQEKEKENLNFRAQSQRKIQLLTVQNVFQFKDKFRIKYEYIAKFLLSTDKALNLHNDQNQKLRKIVNDFEQLILKIKNGSVNFGICKDLRALYKSLEDVERDILQSLDNPSIKQQTASDAKNMEEVVTLNKESEPLPTSTPTPTPTPTPTVALNKFTPITESAVVVEKTEPSTDVPTDTFIISNSCLFASSECLAFYTHINDLYQEKVEKVKPLQFNENFKKFRFACQKAINIPVNAISAVTSEHLQDKFDKLYNLLSGRPLQTSEGCISINDHPLGRDYCILLMAKKFVSQGDTAISSNPQAAFPVASVIVSLWKSVPEFGKIFLAYVFKESPFLVPYFPLKRTDQPVKDWYKILGYHSKDGKLEQQDMFLKRQAGITRLYAAVMIANGRRVDGAIHPYSVEHGWRWLANFVLLNPLPDISATILLEFLQTIGSELWTAYGKQFGKLLLYTQQHYFPKLSAIDEGGPKARLEILLAKILKEGQIPKISGFLSVEFW